jgi:hypothetical protein
MEGASFANAELDCFASLAMTVINEVATTAASPAIVGVLKKRSSTYDVRSSNDLRVCPKTP